MHSRPEARTASRRSARIAICVALVVVVAPFLTVQVYGAVMEYRIRHAIEQSMERIHEQTQNCPKDKTLFAACYENIFRPMPKSCCPS
jgi:hypothetical protein